jgi:sugar lactone lactonase YvrE
VNNSNLGRSARGLSVTAAFLAGCGAPQAPLVAPGATPLQAQMRAASATATIPPLRQTLQRPGYKVTAPLIYVTNYGVTYNDISVYRARAKHPTPLATISDGINTPSGACIDAQGTLYVTNQPPSGPGWISEYPLGKTAPSKVVKNGVNTPAFCAIDAKGNLWVTNIGLDDVAEYLKGATKPHAVITSGLTYPDGIAIDHSGNLYVGNLQPYETSDVQVFAAGSKSPSRTITDGVTWPAGITVDSNGTLYVTNVEQNNVEEYRSGQDDPFQTIKKGMSSPADVTVNRNGFLYITNNGNNTVVEFPPGSLTPSKRQISEGLEDPVGAAYYPALLP